MSLIAFIISMSEASAVTEFVRRMVFSFASRVHHSMNGCGGELKEKGRAPRGLEISFLIPHFLGRRDVPYVRIARADSNGFPPKTFLQDSFRNMEAPGSLIEAVVEHISRSHSADSERLEREPSVPPFLPGRAPIAYDLAGMCRKVSECAYPHVLAPQKICECI
jgi:hypothetical protein